MIPRKEITTGLERLVTNSRKIVKNRITLKVFKKKNLLQPKNRQSRLVSGLIL